MATSPKRVAWDACSWISLINMERQVADGIDRYTRSRSVLEQAASGKLEIICSALCIVEVCKNRDVMDQDADKLAAFFEHEYVVTTALGREIATLARALMMRKIPKLKPPDACHLATALEVPRVVELHTFDDKLIALNGKLTKRDGTALKICFPDVGGPMPPLLGGAGSK